MTTVTTCHHCGDPYDPLEAPWCDGPVDDPTLVCPLCAACFCDATSSYRDGFWQLAPEELWQRRAARAAVAGDDGGAGASADGAPVVLLLCPERTARLELKRALSPLDCRLAFASDRDECLEQARRHRPVLVIADDRVEGLDDDRFARSLRSGEKLAGTRVALLSSLYRTAAQRTEARARLDIDAIVGRPISPADAETLLRGD